MTDGLRFSSLSLTFLSLFFQVLDVALDVLTAVSFYRGESYASLGVLVLLLVGSSVLVQAFSWLWFKDKEYQKVTKVEKSVSDRHLKLIHFLLCGVYFRYAGVVEMSIPALRSPMIDDPKFHTQNLKHDLNLLRLIETFSESSPQLILMLTIFLRQNHFRLVTVLKALGSAMAIALCVTKYYRAVCAVAPGKDKPPWIALVVYFVWNLLLISPRIAALALFASHLPCYIFAHFLCSWTLLLFCVWLYGTQFMESPGAEWLYRATVSVVWYFNWFEADVGKPIRWTLLYHSYILVDISILCGVWCFKLSTEPPYFEIPQSYHLITAFCTVAVYILGLCVEIIYHRLYHRTIAMEDLEGNVNEMSGAGSDWELSCSLRALCPCRYKHPPDASLREMGEPGQMGGRRPSLPPSWKTGRPTSGLEDCRLMDFHVEDEPSPEPPSPLPLPPTRRYNKRMMKLAANFYS